MLFNWVNTGGGFRDRVGRRRHGCLRSDIQVTRTPAQPTLTTPGGCAPTSPGHDGDTTARHHCCTSPLSVVDGDARPRQPRGRRWSGVYKVQVNIISYKTTHRCPGTSYTTYITFSSCKTGSSPSCCKTASTKSCYKTAIVSSISTRYKTAIVLSIATSYKTAIVLSIATRYKTAIVLRIATSYKTAIVLSIATCYKTAV